MSLSSKLIVNVAITGTIPTKSDTQHVPVTLTEIVTCARQVRDAGASIVHLHARNDRQQPVSDSSVYIELVNAVRDACPDLILCVSLTGRHTQDINMRAAALESKPDMASLTLGSLNFPA